MHELTITRGILKVVVDTAQQHDISQVQAVHLVIGELSGFVDESVQFYFDHLSRNTPAEGAKLYFRREPAWATCQQCGHQFGVRPPLFEACPVCGNEALQVQGGQECYVDSIEVADAADVST